jgi:hypothetical protein
MAFLIGAPMAAVAVGQWAAHAAGTGIVFRPHAVQAVLIQSATSPGSGAAAVRSTRVLVRARRTSADGSSRTGEVPAPAGAAAGAAVTVQLATADRVAGPPQQGGSAVGPVLTALRALAASALMLIIALRLIRQILDWWRLAAWEPPGGRSDRAGRGASPDPGAGDPGALGSTGDDIWEADMNGIPADDDRSAAAAADRGGRR